MARRRKPKEEEKGASRERWMLSYLDFITLLMVFFVLMYSLSKVDLEKYNAIAESLSVVLTGSSISDGEKRGTSVVPSNSGQQQSKTSNEELINQAQLKAAQKQIQEFINSENADTFSPSGGQTSTQLKNYIEIIQQERGLVISLKDTFLFPIGSDVLNPQATNIMKQLGLALVKIPNYVLVEGHTDNLPINTAKFPSNWELSVMRATTVMHVLQDEAGISPERLSVVGYGEYRPLVPNINAVNQARNRRVDIVILKKKYGDFQPKSASIAP